MRSRRGLTGTVALLAGVALAFLSDRAFGGGGTEILHLALGVCFILLAAAVFDFRGPRSIALAAAVAIGALGAIFLLQGLSDLTRWAFLANLAYGVLGQSLERALGFAFLGWCAVLIFFDGRGPTRLLGALALTVVIGVEIYIYASAGEASPALKLFYLPIFVWLLLESGRPREA